MDLFSNGARQIIFCVEHVRARCSKTANGNVAVADTARIPLHSLPRGRKCPKLHSGL